MSTSNHRGPCGQCSHPFAEHLMLAGSDALAGGIMVCPVPICACFSTWSTNGDRPSPQLQYELYREYIRGELSPSSQYP